MTSRSLKATSSVRHIEVGTLIFALFYCLLRLGQLSRLIGTLAMTNIELNISSFREVLFLAVLLLQLIGLLVVCAT